MNDEYWYFFSPFCCLFIPFFPFGLEILMFSLLFEFQVNLLKEQQCYFLEVFVEICFEVFREVVHAA